ncbi:MAG: hypothetical protein VKL59_24210 [Nostocaceae cyanobacterium]|nr:hypothetical protein [Nostocaceae cyanobacterium]
MESRSSEAEAQYIVEVNWADRWLIYRRLQELEIPCCCSTNQPLTVDIGDAIRAVQLWSVIRQLTARRQDLIDSLESCWNKNFL